jgi:hypothetical protein
MNFENFAAIFGLFIENKIINSSMLVVGVLKAANGLKLDFIRVRKAIRMIRVPKKQVEECGCSGSTSERGLNSIFSV